MSQYASYLRSFSIGSLRGTSLVLRSCNKSLNYLHDITWKLEKKKSLLIPHGAELLYQ